MFEWRLLGIVGFFVLCSANQRLLIDQLRWEFLEIENALWAFSTNGLQYKSQEDAEIYLVHEFHNFDQNLTKIPEDQLYGSEAIRQIPQFLFLFSELHDIHTTYEKFRDYLQQNLNGDKNKIAAEDLIYDITNNKTGVVKTVDRVIELAYQERDSIRQGIYEMFQENYWCKNTQQSPQQVTYNLYNLIALAQLKAYVLHQFALLGNILWEGDQMNLSTDERTSFEKNATHMIKLLALDMNQPGDIWRCDPKMFRSGKTSVSQLFTSFLIRPEEGEINYDQFTRLLQGHIQNEVDMNSRGTCRETCETYSFAKSHGCYDYESDICRKIERCSGDLHECFFVESHASVCVSNSKHRRYDYVKYNSGKRLGKDSYCSNRRTVHSWTRWFVRCHYCMCLCDQHGPTSDRHINLRPVLADVKNNRIVTGLKLIKHNRLLHLQIQEGQLLPYGYINQSTVNWVKLDDYTITNPGAVNGKDFFTMTYTERAMALDEINVRDENHVLTGVRFQVRNNKIHFEIHVSPFDWHTGFVKHQEGYYIYETSSLGGRSKIQFSAPDIPIYTTQPSEMYQSNAKRYIEFTHTDFDKDAAQTTIPFIDIQEVVNKPAVPLMGAGVYYKGNRGYGGFIAPRIKTYDYGRHVSSKMPKIAEKFVGLSTDSVPLN